MNSHMNPFAGPAMYMSRVGLGTLATEMSVAVKVAEAFWQQSALAMGAPSGPSPTTADLGL
jgi:hypothetical protein